MKGISFNPPDRILFGPGPSPVHPRVLAALARPTVGHLDPAFVEMMDDLKDGLREVFRTQNTLTFPFSGPATVGQEALIVNLLERGDLFIACINGVFGERMAQMAERAGAEVVRFQQPWGRAVDPQALRETLKAHPGAKLVGFVHAETSTGVLSDAESLVKEIHAAGAMALMDCVTSLGGIRVDVDAWGVDAAYSGTQKCLATPPGLGPVTLSQRAYDVIKARKTPVQSWFMDITSQTKYWGGTGHGGRSYHHTAPINALYGLHEGLLMVHEEGLENAWARHARVHKAFVAGVEAMGLAMLVPPAEQANSINTVRVPEGVDEAKVRERLMGEHNIAIGKGLGDFAGKVWRIGTMGRGATLDNARLCLSSLEAVLHQLGAKVKPGAAAAAIAAASA
ncbi:MAG TPA: alanine--glyoxylate aminotransferase family protein [Nevskiaceae bacterium]|nr:alanine--glyoxylate aminotransferase family protein [Nevskiaceae bacterium]